MSKQVKHAKTVIIGAGISGISAALNFIKHDYHSFLLIEANERIGGRCHTVPCENGYVELGAQYMHGQLGNPLFSFAKENNLISKEDHEITQSGSLNLKVHLDSDDGCHQYFLKEGGEELPRDLVNRLNEILDDLIVEARDEKWKNCSKEASVGDFIYNSYEKRVKEEFPKQFLDNETRKYIFGIFDWRCKYENLVNGCESTFNMSLRNFDNVKELVGTKTIQIERGYKSIIDGLISGHKESFNSKLRLKHALNNILLCKNLTNEANKTISECKHCKYTEDSDQIVLKISDLTNGSEVIVICENVICTMSLGFMKENFKNIVRPSSLVPNEKFSAISRLGYGIDNKIFLVYEEPFWNEDCMAINLVWPYEDKSELLKYLNHEFDVKRNWFRDMQIIEPCEFVENVLLCWVGGNCSHESLTDEEISQDCTRILQKFMPQKNIPSPKKIIRSSWNTNEYFRGSYSYCKTGGEPNDHKTLSLPIEFGNKLLILFAGEATSVDHFGTVHGAYASGIRESERILKQI